MYQYPRVTAIPELLQDKLIASDAPQRYLPSVATALVHLYAPSSHLLNRLFQFVKSAHFLPLLQHGGHGVSTAELLRQFLDTEMAIR